MRKGAVRNQAQETAPLVQTVLNQGFLLSDFGLVSCVYLGRSQRRSRGTPRLRPS